MKSVSSVALRRDETNQPGTPRDDRVNLRGSRDSTVRAQSHGRVGVAPDERLLLEL